MECFTRLHGVSPSLFDYFTLSNRSNELYVDDPESGDTIPVFLEIFLPKLGCECKLNLSFNVNTLWGHVHFFCCLDVGIDIQDEMGRHEVGFVENTDKVPVNGGEGCLFTSAFKLNKVGFSSSTFNCCVSMHI